MSVAATRRELDKVTFETKRVSRRDEPDSASDTESDVTELAEGEDEPEYYPGEWTLLEALSCRSADLE